MTVITELVAKLGFQVDEKAFTDWSRRVQETGARLGNLGRQLTVGLTLPILGAGTYIGKVAMDFEAAMNQVQAKTGETGATLNGLREQAKQLGMTTKFSATEVAQGMTEFAKAGLNASQIAIAMRDAVGLAAAAETDLAGAVQISVASMGQFQLGADQIGRISDVMAKAADASIISMQDLAESLAYVGPTAYSAGLSIEETSAAVAALGDLGVKGSRAGMALGSALNVLRAPSDTAKKALRSIGTSSSELFDSTGKLRISLSQLFTMFRGVPADQLRDIFGQEILRSMTGLFNAGTKIDSVMKELGNSQGYAAKQAAVLTKGAKGGLTQLKAALQGLAIQIGDTGFLAGITKVVGAITKLLRELAQVSPTILRVTTAFLGLVAVVGPVLLGISAIGKAIAFLSAPAGAFALKIAAVVLVLAGIALVIEDFYAFMQGRPSVFAFVLANAEGWIAKAKSWFGEVLPLLLQTFFGTTAANAKEWSDTIVKTFTAVYDIIKNIFEFSGELIAVLGFSITDGMSKAWESLKRSFDIGRDPAEVAGSMIPPTIINGIRSPIPEFTRTTPNQTITVSSPISIEINAADYDDPQGLAAAVSEQLQLELGAAFRAVGRNVRSPYRN